MFQSFIVPFVTICLAELGDKSQLSILLLSSKVKKHSHLLIGILLAFLIVDGLAILLGAWITKIIPTSILSIISGLVFIIFGILTLRSKVEEESEQKINKSNAFISGFLIIFLAEWGDKTQIASALFAAKYEPLPVLLGVMTALLILSTSAIYIGKFLFRKVDKKVISTISGFVFVTIGFLTILFR